MSIFDDSAKALGTAQGTYDRVAAGGAPAQSMNAYINPYQTQVINDTMGRMHDQYNQVQMQTGDAANAGGAFGGARHGIVEATNADNYLRSSGELAGQLNQQGFDRVASLGMQDVNQQLQAAGGLTNTSGQGFNMGRALTADQASQGMLQQQLAQQILGGASQQFDQYIGHPQQSLNQTIAALSGNPLMGERTQMYTPGVMDWMSNIGQTVGRVGAGAATGGTAGGKGK